LPLDFSILVILIGNAGLDLATKKILMRNLLMFYKNGLKQFVAEPTSYRVTDEPHVLDLIISRDDI